MKLSGGGIDVNGDIHDPERPCMELEGGGWLEEREKIKGLRGEGEWLARFPLRWQVARG